MDSQERAFRDEVGAFLDAELTAGLKRRQTDIETAQARWRDYKARKKGKG